MIADLWRFILEVHLERLRWRVFPGYVPLPVAKQQRRHRWMCRLVMAFARRRVCTCGASRVYDKRATRRRWLRSRSTRGRR